MPLDFAGELAALKAARVRIELRLAQISVWPERARVATQLDAGDALYSARHVAAADQANADGAREILTIWNNLNQSIDAFEMRLTQSPRRREALAEIATPAANPLPTGVETHAPANPGPFRTRVKIRARQIAIEAGPAVAEAAGVVRPAPELGDDLTAIRGIDRALAAKLSALGVDRFSQIVAWRRDDVRGLAAILGIGRQISRQNWIEQAALLAPEIASAAMAVVDAPSPGMQPPSISDSAAADHDLDQVAVPPPEPDLPVADVTGAVGRVPPSIAGALQIADAAPDARSIPALEEPAVVSSPAAAETFPAPQPAGSAAVIAALLAAYPSSDYEPVALLAFGEPADLPLPVWSEDPLAQPDVTALATESRAHAVRVEPEEPDAAPTVVISAAKIAADAAATVETTEIEPAAVAEVALPPPITMLADVAPAALERRSLFFAKHSFTPHARAPSPVPSQVETLAIDLDAIIHATRSRSVVASLTGRPAEPARAASTFEIDHSERSESQRDVAPSADRTVQASLRAVATDQTHPEAAASGAVKRWKEAAPVPAWSSPAPDSALEAPVESGVEQNFDHHSPAADVSGFEAEVEIVVRDLAVVEPAAALPPRVQHHSLPTRIRRRLGDRGLFAAITARPDAADEASVVIVHRRSDEHGAPDLAFYQETPLARRETKIRRFLQALSGDRR